ncbi:MAG: VWA domain-containing protein [Candidatus Melainabacteria bacterium]|nr:VWA domain-containing protein [Candidatus Melainabacteria bacterium]
MIRNKLFLFLLIFVLNTLVVFAGNENPFLSNKENNENPYSVNKRTILIVFDASGSMEEKIRGETKIHIAKRVLENVISNADSDVNIGLRVYGLSIATGNPSIDCNDSRLLVLPGVENRRLIISEIYQILPRGFTPITYSLSQAVQDLSPYQGERSIILISDGLETCGGDPCQLAHTLKASNIDLKIDVVGFGIKDDWAARQQLKCIALNTSGRYFAADSAEELTRSLSESINKTVTGRIITMIGKEVKVKSEETEGYENLPKLQSEKLILKRKSRK